KVGPVFGNWIAQKRTLSGSLMVMLTGMSFAPFGLPAKLLIWSSGLFKSGPPVAVFSAQSRTLGNVAGAPSNVNVGKLILFTLKIRPMCGSAVMVWTPSNGMIAIA